MAAPVRYQLAPPTFVQLSADAEAGVGGLTFSVLTYNILAQAYVRKASFPTTPHSLLRWKHRKDAVVEMIKAHGADILCLQEVDNFATYEEELSHAGYEGLYRKRNGRKADGSALYWDPRRFDVPRFIDIDMDMLANHPRLDGPAEQLRYSRRNVAIIGHMRALGADGLPLPGAEFVVATTHLFWDPAYEDVRVAQAAVLVHEIQRFNHDRLPVVLCGDFNSLPDTPTYQYLAAACFPRTAWADRLAYSRHRTGASPLPPATPEAAAAVADAVAGTGANASADAEADTDVGTDAAGAFAGLVPASQPEPSVADSPATALVLPDVPPEAALSVESAMQTPPADNPLPLQSAYAAYDNGAEPAATNIRTSFVGTLDYIFYTAPLRPMALLRVPTVEEGLRQGGLPDTSQPSDHVPLMATFWLP